MGLDFNKKQKKSKKLEVQIQTTLPIHAIHTAAPTSASSTRATQDVWNWHDGRGLLRWQERAAFVAQCSAHSQLHQGGAMCQRRRVLPDHGCLLSGNACSHWSGPAHARGQAPAHGGQNATRCTACAGAVGGCRRVRHLLNSDHTADAARSPRRRDKAGCQQGGPIVGGLLHSGRVWVFWHDLCDFPMPTSLTRVGASWGLAG